MPRYRVRFEGFAVVEAENPEAAEFMDNELYAEKYITDVEEIDSEEMFM